MWVQHVEALGLQPQPIGHAPTGHQPADQPSQPQAHTQQVHRLLNVAVAECPLKCAVEFIVGPAGRPGIVIASSRPLGQQASMQQAELSCAVSTLCWWVSAESDAVGFGH